MTHATVWDGFCLSYLLHLQSTAGQYKIVDTYALSFLGAVLWAVGRDSSKSEVWPTISNLVKIKFEVSHRRKIVTVHCIHSTPSSTLAHMVSSECSFLARAKIDPKYLEIHDAGSDSRRTPIHAAKQEPPTSPYLSSNLSSLFPYRTFEQPPQHHLQLLCSTSCLIAFD